MSELIRLDSVDRDDEPCSVWVRTSEIVAIDAPWQAYRGSQGEPRIAMRSIRLRRGKIAVLDTSENLRILQLKGVIP